MSDIIFKENEQKFIMLPDGDIATHTQIKDAYDREIKSNYISKSSLLQLIKLIDNDVKYNQNVKPEAKIDPMNGNTIYRQTTIVYSPEIIKKHLEKLL